MQRTVAATPTALDQVLEFQPDGKRFLAAKKTRPALPQFLFRCWVVKVLNSQKAKVLMCGIGPY